jgi:hypothetical protein
MDGFDQGQLIRVLLMTVAALFVLSGMPPVARWRQRFRRAAIAVYAAAAALAVLGVILWLIGPR